ncbi:MAG: hypothetical protein PH343_08645, partial [Nitrospira sp.]|nr:hypothetical protein [Nitrospira sp.]
MLLSENKILRRLNDLPSNNIYYLSPRECFLRGFDYYRTRSLCEFIWSKDRQLLTAKVIGTNIYLVVFYEDADKLHYECNCPAWSNSRNCKHII